MPTINLQHYASKPLVMDFGVKITSPVPDGEQLKVMKAITEYSAVTAVVGEATAKNGGDVQAAVSAIDVPEVLVDNADLDISVLALGEEEVLRLREADCPEPLIEKAGMYALLYWATGEDTAAGNAWLEQVEATRNPKASEVPAPEGSEGQKAPQTLAEWAPYGVGEPVDTPDGPLYSDYRTPPAELRPKAPEKPGATWAWFMGHWPLVQADLMQVYGVRDDRAGDYAGPWFVNLVYQLLTIPDTRSWRAWMQEHE